MDAYHTYTCTLLEVCLHVVYNGALQVCLQLFAHALVDLTSDMFIMQLVGARLFPIFILCKCVFS